MEQNVNENTSSVALPQEDVNVTQEEAPNELNSVVVIDGDTPEELTAQEPAPDPFADVHVLKDAIPNSPAFNAFLDMQSTIVKSGVTGQNPKDLFPEIQANPDKEGQLRQLVIDKSNQDIAAVDQWTRKQFEDDPLNLQDTVIKSQYLTKEYSDEHNSPLAAEHAVIEQLSKHDEPFDISRARQKEAEFGLAVANDMNKILGEMGLLEKIITIAGGFIPFATLPQIQKTAEFFSPENSVQFSPEQIQDFAIRMKSLDPARRLELLPTYKSMVLQATKGDKYLAAQFLNLLIEPGQGEQEAATARLNAGFVVADTIGLGGALAGIVKLSSGSINMFGQIISNITNFSTKTSSAAHLANKAGNKEMAGGIVASTLADPTGNISTASQLDRYLARQIADPIDLSKYDPTAIKGLAPEVTKQLTEFNQMLQDANDLIKSGGATPGQGLLDPSEALGVATKQLENFKTDLVDKYNSKVQVETELGPVTGDAAVLNAKIHYDNGTTGTIQKIVTFTIDDITGTFDIKEIHAGGLHNDLYNTVFSDSFKYGVQNNEFREGATRTFLGDIGLNRITNDLNREIYKDLGMSQRNNIDVILRTGDDHINEAGQRASTTYSPAELKGGINTPEGVVALKTDAEVASYYKARQHMDYAYNLENNAFRQKEVRAGKKSIDFGTSNEKVVPIKDPQVKAAITTGQVKRVYNKSTSEMVDISYNPKIVDEWKSNGLTLVRIDNDLVLDAEKVRGLSANERVSYVLINKDELKELPAQVLEYRQGHVPAYYKHENFFVHEETSYMANGTEKKGKRLIATFSSKRQADRHAAEVNAKKAAAGDPHPAFVKGDRELTVEELYTSGATTNPRGIMFGRRAEVRAGYGPDSVSPERLPATESFDRMMKQLNKLISRGAYNEHLKKVWVNSANKLGHPITSFNQDIPIGALDSDSAKLMEIKTSISKWMGLPTQQDRSFTKTIQAVHDWALDALNKGGGKKSEIASLQWLAHTDPVSAAKAASFNLRLGCYNIGQLVVQYSQALIPMSLNPTNIPRALKIQAMLSQTDNMLSGAARLANMKKIEAGLDSVDDMTAIRHMWEKSGFAEAASVHNYYEKATEGLTASKELFERSLTNAQVMYKKGVDTANRYTFGNSVLEYSKKTGKSVSSLVNDKEALNWIIAKTDRDSFHMLSIAKAKMFEGTLGIPFQFGQIILKSLEAMIGKEFSAGEKAKILTSQVVLLGASATPITGAVTALYLANGVDPEQLQGAAKQKYIALKGGMMDLLAYNLLGADANIAQRVSIMGSMSMFTTDLFTKEVPLLETLGGSFGGVAGQFWTSVQNISDISISTLSARNLTRQDLYTSMQMIGLEIAQNTTGTKNLAQAWLMNRTNKIFSRNGIPIVEKNFSAGDVMAKILGFSPSAVDTTYNLKKYNADKEKAMGDLVGVYISSMVKLKAINGEGDDLSDRFTSNMLTHILHSLDPEEKELFVKKLRNRIENPTNMYEEQAKQYLKSAPEKMLNGLVADGERLRSEGLLVEPLPDK